MKFLEKYKIYRSIIKQEPVDLNVFPTYQSLFKPTTAFKKLTYSVTDGEITAFTKFEIIDYTKNHEFVLYQTGYYAYIDLKNGKNIEFNLLFAKRLFNHGKKYSK